MTGALRTDLRSQAPNLSKAVDELSELWLGKLLAKIRSGIPVEFRPKQVNDPIWGTIELLPWEVALLDTPLLQRMRGVRQLGLAHLVFPGACHGRLEHILGVVGAIEETSRTLMRQIERWNRNNKQQTIPTISEGDLRMVRLAGLLHDIGHGPFSHALEPVLETVSPLGVSDEGSASWRHELRHLRLLLADCRQYFKERAAVVAGQDEPRSAGERWGGCAHGGGAGELGEDLCDTLGIAHAERHMMDHQAIPLGWTFQGCRTSWSGWNFSFGLMPSGSFGTM